MTAEIKIKLVTLGQQLSTVGTEFRVAQLGLERMVEQHGLSSGQAVDASSLCSTLALHFAQLEEEFLQLLSLLPETYDV